MKNELKDHLDYAADSLRTQIGKIQDEIDGAAVDYTETINLAEEIELEIGRLKDQQSIIRKSIADIQPEEEFNLHQCLTQAAKDALFSCLDVDCRDEFCKDLYCACSNHPKNIKRKLDLDQLIS